MTHAWTKTGRGQPVMPSRRLEKVLGLALLVLLLLGLLAPVMGWLGLQNPPALVADLPGTGEERNAEFARRVLQSFPIGLSEETLIAELDRHRFRTKDRPRFA